MELYVPKFQQKEILEVLAGEGVTFEATGKTFFQVVEGKERFEVAEVKANLLETEAPAALRRKGRPSKAAPQKGRIIPG